MLEDVPFIDASVFLGMHHEEARARQRSLAVFQCYFDGQVRMSFEQVGICDAVLWRESRLVQDLYYPFMDRLHSDMRILRQGYAAAEIHGAGVLLAQWPALRPEQALLTAQVMQREAGLFTHDPTLLGLDCLRPHVLDFDALRGRRAFPQKLQALYESSLSFVYAARS